MQQYLSLSAHEGVVYDDHHVSDIAAHFFEPEFWRRQGTGTAIAGGRAQVVFIQDAKRSWVLRHYRRGGWMAKLNKDGYLWLGPKRTRAFREWHLLYQLHRWGLPVPAPVAARYTRCGLLYRADLLTETLPDAKSLAARLNEAVLDSSVWYSIGRTLAEFHQRGVRHADLNAHNVLIDKHGRCFLLDFDRGRLSLPRRGWVDAVLARLKRSLTKLAAQHALHFNQADWQALLQGHDDAFKPSNSQSPTIYIM